MREITHNESQVQDSKFEQAYEALQLFDLLSKMSWALEHLCPKLITVGGHALILSVALECDNGERTFCRITCLLPMESPPSMRCDLLSCV